MVIHLPAGTEELTAERLTPRIAYFDKDRGAEPFIRAIGGRYDVISPGEPTGFNP